MVGMYPRSAYGWYVSTECIWFVCIHGVSMVCMYPRSVCGLYVSTECILFVCISEQITTVPYTTLTN